MTACYRWARKARREGRVASIDHSAHGHPTDPPASSSSQAPTPADPASQSPFARGINRAKRKVSQTPSPGSKGVPSGSYFRGTPQPTPALPVQSLGEQLPIQEPEPTAPNPEPGAVPSESGIYETWVRQKESGGGSVASSQHSPSKSQSPLGALLTPRSHEKAVNQWVNKYTTGISKERQAARLKEKGAKQTAVRLPSMAALLCRQQMERIALFLVRWQRRMRTDLAARARIRAQE